MAFDYTHQINQNIDKIEYHYQILHLNIAISLPYSIAAHTHCKINSILWRQITLLLGIYSSSSNFQATNILIMNKPYTYKSIHSQQQQKNNASHNCVAGKLQILGQLPILPGILIIWALLCIVYKHRCVEWSCSIFVYTIRMILLNWYIILMGKCTLSSEVVWRMMTIVQGIRVRIECYRYFYDFFVFLDSVRLKSANKNQAKD